MPKKKKAESEAPEVGAEKPAGKPRTRMAMTKGDWEKVAERNKRAEREPDPAQIMLGDVLPAAP